MPQHVVLSNGAKLDIPDGTPPDEVRSRASTAETMIKMGVPNLIKSGVGLWRGAQDVAGAAGRVAGAGVDLYPPVGLADLGISGVNALKAVASQRNPGLNNVPDIPTVSGLATSALAPPLGPDHPIQRYAEAAATGALNPKAAVSTGARMLAGTAAGDAGGSIANYLGGPYWEKLGRWLAGTAAATTPETALKPAAVAAFGGGAKGKAVADAGERIGVQPTFGMVASPIGRWLEKGLGSFPVWGAPIQQAQRNASEGIGNVQQDIAARLYSAPGGGAMPTATPASIGSDLIAGARQGAANLTQRAQDEQGRLASQIGPNQPVNLRPVYYGGAAQRYTTSPTTFSALAARLDALRQMAIEAQTPRFQAVSGQMPAGSAPYSRVMNTRSDLGADIPGVSGMSGGVQKNLYASLTDAMRAAAVAKDPALGPAFDFANENYQRIMGQGGQRDQLETIGGQPVKGYSGMAQPSGMVGSAPFTGGKDEGAAYNYLTSNLNSPSSLEPLADPTVFPADFWRRVAGGYLSTLGQTKEGTYRPDIMAQQWGKVDPMVATQLFGGPTGGPLADVANMNDAATLGRNSVVPVERAGLTNTAGTMLAVKWALDKMKDVAGPIAAALGGNAITRGMESPATVNLMAGNGTPLVDALYSNGFPAASAAYNLNNPDDPRNQ
jgi:hypothetical protein